MPLYWWVIDILAVLVLAVALLCAGVLLRRWLVARSGISFDMSVNPHAGPHAAGWMLGTAVYGESELLWYRTLSFSPRPRHRFTRGEVVIDGRREPTGHEQHSVTAGHLIVQSQNADGVSQMAMTPDALTGLLSWLESSPPGRGVNNVV